MLCNQIHMHVCFDNVINVQDYKIEYTLSDNNRDRIPYTMQSGEVGQHGRPTLILKMVLML